MRPLSLLAALCCLAVPTAALSQSAHTSTYVPMQVVAGPAVGDQGTLGRPRFAEFYAHALNAIIIEEPITRGRRTIPAGTAFVMIKSAASEEIGLIWCDVTPTSGWSLADPICVKDSDGDGQLDQTLEASKYPAGYTFGIVAVGRYNPLEQTVSYREAALQERPTSKFALVLCRSMIGQNGFTITVPLYENEWLHGAAPCPMRPTLIDGKQILKFHDMQIEVSKPRDGGTWTVLSTIDPGTVISLMSL